MTTSKTGTPQLVSQVVPARLTAATGRKEGKTRRERERERLQPDLDQPPLPLCSKHNKLRMSGLSSNIQYYMLPRPVIL